MCLPYRHHQQGNDVEQAEINEIKQFRVVQLAIRYANCLGQAAAQVVVDGADEYKFGDRIYRRCNPNTHNDHLELRASIKFIRGG